MFARGFFVLTAFSASQISHNDYMLTLLLGETTVKGSNRLQEPSSTDLQARKQK